MPLLERFVRERFDFRGYTRLPRRVAIVAGLAAIPVLYCVWQDIARFERTTAILAADEQRLEARDKMRAAALRAQRQAERNSRGSGAGSPALSGDVMAMLSHLERAWSNDIALRQLDIDAAARRARIQLATRSVDSLIAYTDRLKATSARVVLERHATDTARPPAWRLEAHLTAEWP